MHGSVPFEGDKHTLEVWKIMNLTIMLKSRTGKTKNICCVRESFMWHEMVKTVAKCSVVECWWLLPLALSSIPGDYLDFFPL